MTTTPTAKPKRGYDALGDDSVKLPCWVPRKFRDACRAAADAEKRSLGNWIRFHLAKHLQKGWDKR